ncbi:uncharacterized protein O3Q21_013943 isoform 1-T2 [Podargus strigoides]
MVGEESGKWQKRSEGEAKGRVAEAKRENEGGENDQKKKETRASNCEPHSADFHSCATQMTKNCSVRTTIFSCLWGRSKDALQPPVTQFIHEGASENRSMFSLKIKVDLPDAVSTRGAFTGSLSLSNAQTLTRVGFLVLAKG